MHYRACFFAAARTLIAQKERSPVFTALAGSVRLLRKHTCFRGDLACTLTGLEGDDKRELVRMLVNSLVRILLGMFAAVAIT